MIVSNMEKNVAAITKSGLKLNPDTVRTMSGTQKTNKPLSSRFYITLIIILLGLLIFN